MTDGPHALLTLQERDTVADQLRHRRAHLPERARLDEAVAALADVEQQGGEATAARDDLLRRQGAFETELADVEKRIGEIDRRMRSGAVTASRDLQAMADQIDALKRRRSDLEDGELEVMEQLEPLEARVAELQARWATLDSSVAELRAAVEAAEVVIDSELASALAAREEALASVPPALLPTYDRLRQRLGGVAVAALAGNSCSGCHLTLAASELDRIRRLPPDELATCEQCGRILVRP